MMILKILEIYRDSSSNISLRFVPTACSHMNGESGSFISNLNSSNESAKTFKENLKSCASDCKIRKNHDKKLSTAGGTVLGNLEDISNRARKFVFPNYAHLAPSEMTTNAICNYCHPESVLLNST